MDSINLVLSNRCQAACVWCPSTRGTKQKYDMPFELVERIVEEVTSESFPFEIKSVRLSENGEAILNRDFFKIARYIRKKLPNSRIDLMSNFLSLDKDKSAIIVKERLVDALTVNIDGHDKESYEAVKRVDYETVIQNLKDFNSLHVHHGSTIEVLVNAMPYYEYDQAVRWVLRTQPLNYIDHRSDKISKKIDRSTRAEDIIKRHYSDEVPYSNFNLVLKSLHFLHNNPYMRFKKSRPGLWAERQSIADGTAKPVMQKNELSCPELLRVMNEAFISPAGDWYPCCLDDNQDISLGNVYDSTILEIYNSEKRQTFIQMLVDKKFDEIGYPCNTVEACQTIVFNDVKDYCE